MPETLEVGSIKCTLLSDGHFTYPAAWFFSNVEPARLEETLRQYGLEPDQILSPYTCMLIDTGAHKVLVDTGAGNLAPTTGSLLPELEKAGVRPEEIDTVILTHGHPDHVGGNLDAEGRPAFTEARYVMSKTEWDFWTDASVDLRSMNIPEEMKTLLTATAHRCLPPLKKQVDLVERETDVVPGVRLLPAPGHTPGQMAVLVSSGKEQFLNLADSVIHPLCFEHADWRTMFDLAPDTAAETRRQLVDRASAEGFPVMAFHFPSAKAGRIVSRGANRWGWEPLP